ncbi:hypothetical protein ES319_D08G156700v1 [Gossypium barbadense]|uniref:Uncharacterized protein n=1 Tax=Gossypium barbadense TaxID=3634 RepID=A0A5J5QEE8_GOSBA|nr:hypothetical protein ES319_D08G156700v1 [Gossypium barbadense]
MRVRIRRRKRKQKQDRAAIVMLYICDWPFLCSFKKGSSKLQKDKLMDPCMITAGPLPLLESAT